MPSDWFDSMSVGKEEIDMRYETPLLQAVGRASEIVQGVGPVGVDNPVYDSHQPFFLDCPSNLEER